MKRDEIIEKAQDSFWKVIAESYPEIKSGDFPFDAAFDFDKACNEAVDIWVKMNSEEYQNDLL